MNSGRPSACELGAQIRDAEFSAYVRLTGAAAFVLLLLLPSPSLLLSAAAALALTSRRTVAL